MDFELKNYLDLPNINNFKYSKLHRKQMLFLNTAATDKKIKTINQANYKVAILGVPEDRNSSNKGACTAPDKIREKLYSLYLPNEDFKIIDLGNLKKGKKVKDTYIALAEIYEYLQQIGIIPLIIGGTQDLILPIFDYYDKKKQPFNITNIDARVDLGEVDTLLDNHTFLNRLIHEGSSFLFDYTHLAYQGYYVAPQDIDLLNDLWFNCVRLGHIQADIREAEPFLRDTDFACFDIGAVRQSDAPGVSPTATNGLFGQEACQISRYAGMSDRLTGFGIFETNPTLDINEQTTELTAQIAWHFIQGVLMRKHDFPIRPIKDYEKYIVTTQILDNELFFYKSPSTERWWVEIPYLEKKKEKKIIISCSEKDYQLAENGDLPNRWLRYYKKLSSAASRYK